MPGVLVFRGNNYRSGGAYGTADIKEKKLNIVWEQPTGEIRGEGPTGRAPAGPASPCS